LVGLERNAFQGSGLTSIVIPSSISVIDHFCFSDCKSLLSVTFESMSRLIRLEGWAFTESGLISIIIPSSRKMIDPSCFSGVFILRGRRCTIAWWDFRMLPLFAGRNCRGTEGRASYAKPGGGSRSRTTIWASGYTLFPDSQMDETKATRNRTRNHLVSELKVKREQEIHETYVCNRVQKFETGLNNRMPRLEKYKLLLLHFNCRNRMGMRMISW
jgi:hypothetical protein